MGLKTRETISALRNKETSQFRGVQILYVI